MKYGTVLLLAAPLLLCSAAASAQDVRRGQQLFENTRGVTGKPIGNCVSCHANRGALSEMIANQGAKPRDARSIRRLLQAAIDGAIPGAVNAKAQFRGVLTARDLDDLAAYLASAKAAALHLPNSEARADPRSPQERG